jgi:16S rRNA (adenine1518-N6/adenine1519-N6)-dimethyltransferase
VNSRSLLRQHNLRPRKGLGQHFLVNDAILAAIAAAAHIQPDDTIVEVGPGMGALTTVMARQAGRILAVELDAALVEKMGALLASFNNVHVIQGDILEINLEEQMARIVPAPAAAAYKVVANLPYYITTPTLRYFFDQRQRPSLIVVTVQAEVARRMVAAPPDMNFLAVLVQFYGAPEIVRLVPPGAFYPPPKVGSAVVRITLREQLPLDASQTQQFFRLVSAGFSQPRKQLHNPLMQGTGRARAEIIAALHSCGLDEKQRAETLTVQDWLHLLLYLFPS